MARLLLVSILSFYTSLELVNDHLPRRLSGMRSLSSPKIQCREEGNSQVHFCEQARKEGKKGRKRRDKEKREKKKAKKIFWAFGEGGDDRQ